MTIKQYTTKIEVNLLKYCDYSHYHAVFFVAIRWERETSWHNYSLGGWLYERKTSWLTERKIQVGRLYYSVVSKILNLNLGRIDISQFIYFIINRNSFYYVRNCLKVNTVTIYRAKGPAIVTLNNLPRTFFRCNSGKKHKIPYSENEGKQN